METGEEKQTKLTPRNVKFALTYVHTGDKYKAYEIAGYEAKEREVQTAAISRLLRNPDIQKCITEFEHEYALAAGVTEERIIANLAEIAFDKTCNKSDRNRSLELLGKSRGMWTDVIKTHNETEPLAAERQAAAKEAARQFAEIERQRIIKMKSGDAV